MVYALRKGVYYGKCKTNALRQLEGSGIPRHKRRRKEDEEVDHRADQMAGGDAGCAVSRNRADRTEQIHGRVGCPRLHRQQEECVVAVNRLLLRDHTQEPAANADAAGYSRC